jgi:hypothetical protein
MQLWNNILHQQSLRHKRNTLPSFVAENEMVDKPWMNILEDLPVLLLVEIAHVRRKNRNDCSKTQAAVALRYLAVVALRYLASVPPQ